MLAIAVAMGTDENLFEAFCDADDNTLRLLHYSCGSAEVFKKNQDQVTAGAHIEYGSLMLLV